MNSSLAFCILIFSQPSLGARTILIDFPCSTLLKIWSHTGGPQSSMFSRLKNNLLSFTSNGTLLESYSMFFPFKIFCFTYTYSTVAPKTKYNIQSVSQTEGSGRSLPHPDTKMILNYSCTLGFSEWSQCTCLFPPVCIDHKLFSFCTWN